MPIRLILADDAHAVRRGVRRFLDHSPEVDIIGEAENLKELLSLIESAQPDVAVFDLFMVVRSSLADAVQRVCACRCALVAMSFANDTEALRLAAQVQAFRLLDKVTLPETLLPAICEAAAAPNFGRPPAS